MMDAKWMHSYTIISMKLQLRWIKNNFICHVNICNIVQQHIRRIFKMEKKIREKKTILATFLQAGQFPQSRPQSRYFPLENVVRWYLYSLEQSPTIAGYMSFTCKYIYQKTF